MLPESSHDGAGRPLLQGRPRAKPTTAMRSSMRTSVVLSAIAAGAMGCGDGTAPRIQPRSYQLALYGGAPLPVTLRRIVETSTVPGGPTVTCDERLTASNLELLTTRQFTQTDSHLVVCDDGRPDAASPAVLRGTYASGADTVVLTADVGTGASYVSFARMTSDGLTIYRREAGTSGGATSIDPTQLVFRSAGP